MANDRHGRDDIEDARRILAEVPPERPAQLTRWMTRLLDDMATVPGTNVRVGLDPLLSLVPGAGTTVGTAFGAVMLADAIRLRMPLPVLARMGGNYLIDWLVGMIPFLGVFGDLAFRANRRNLKLLNRTIADRDQVRDASVKYWIAAAAIVVGLLLVVITLTMVVLGWAWTNLRAA